MAHLIETIYKTSIENAYSEPLPDLSAVSDIASSP